MSTHRSTTPHNTAADNGHGILHTLFPTRMFNLSSAIWLIAAIMSLLWFDVVWCMATTFTAFSRAETYVNAITAGLIIALPAMMFPRLCRGVQALLLIVLCIWLECNLIYSRTYFSAIPLSSYALAGNLADFTSSVTDSLRAADLGFVAIIAVAIWLGYRRGPQITLRDRLTYVAYIVVMAIVSGLLLATRGGLRQAWEDLENCHHHSCRVPMFTVAGSLAHDLITEHTRLSHADFEAVETWLDTRTPLTALPDSLTRRYDSMIIIMCESLESWPIGLTLEGKEITPNLNRLISDTTTFYAPNVLTQVGPGRSIDAQLIINAGLLPMQQGVYSMKVPFNRYYTLNQALASKNGARSYLLTVDKPVVWNQGAVASSFAIDTLLVKDDWRLDEKAGGYRLKLGDRSFLTQVTEKMESGEIWPEGQPAFIQLVTYSGHNPFILPEELDNLHLTAEYPEIARRYLTVAHYTDEGLGIFLNYLRTRRDYDNTLIVITGDHEGLADYRSDLAARLPYVSPQQLTPLIIANAPLGRRHDSLMGQIDIYPTLLSMAGLTDYPWHGLGTDVLSPSAPAAAVDPTGILTGDTLSLPATQRDHMLMARKVSDRILRFNLLDSIYGH